MLLTTDEETSRFWSDRSLELVLWETVRKGIPVVKAREEEDTNKHFGKKKWFKTDITQPYG